MEPALLVEAPSAGIDPAVVQVFAGFAVQLVPVLDIDPADLVARIAAAPVDPVGDTVAVAEVHQHDFVAEGRLVVGLLDLVADIAVADLVADTGVVGLDVHTAVVDLAADIAAADPVADTVDLVVDIVLVVHKLAVVVVSERPEFALFERPVVLLDLELVTFVVALLVDQPELPASVVVMLVSSLALFLVAMQFVAVDWIVEVSFVVDQVEVVLSVKHQFVVVVGIAVG